MQVRPGDNNYEEMHEAYKANKGERFIYNNLTWMSVYDNDAVYFVLIERSGGMDSFYQSMISTPRNGKK